MSNNTPLIWSIYIVKCSDGSLYTGISNNVDKRIANHNSGKGAKYTRVRLPVTLVHIEKSINRSTASKREIEIKKLTRVQKLALINRA
ncbi:MAG: GIY-YIG nuclease family protein [Rhizobiales bacterium]|nr:GIY-YIG nuclease family protein [Hyphomicrobiales bacterium]